LELIERLFETVLEGLKFFSDFSSSVCVSKKLKNKKFSPKSTRFFPKLHPRPLEALFVVLFPFEMLLVGEDELLPAFVFKDGDVVLLLQLDVFFNMLLTPSFR
jgi:hypothetical protein